MYGSGSNTNDLDSIWSTRTGVIKRGSSDTQLSDAEGDQAQDEHQRVDSPDVNNSLTMSVLQSGNSSAFQELTGYIQQGLIETAMNTINDINPNDSSLGRALVLAIECGMGEVVGCFLDLPGASNTLPRALVMMQSSAASKRNWKGTVREKTYEAIVEAIVKKTDFELDESAKIKLNTALEHMIENWEGHAIVLLGNSNVVKHLDCDKLLRKSIDSGVKNSKAAKLLISEGAQNIISALSLIQSYTGTTQKWNRINWSENNGYEEVRSSLITSLATRVSKFSESELVEVNSILLCIIRSHNYTRINELRALFFHNPNLSIQCDVDNLITEALTSSNGQAVEILAKCDARKLPSHLVWLHNNQFFYWQTGSWLATHLTFVRVLARKWDEAFSKEEKELPLYGKYIRLPSVLDDSQKLELVKALKYIILNNPDQAEILCGGDQQSAVKKLDDVDRCNLVEFSLQRRNFAVAKGLVENANRELVTALQGDLSETLLYKVLLDDILAKPVILNKIGYKKNLLAFLEAVVQRGEHTLVLLDKLLDRDEVKDNLSQQDKLDLFRAALKAKQFRAARKLLECQSIGLRLRALHLMQVDFNFRVNEVVQKEQPSVDRTYYVEMVSETLGRGELYASYAAEDRPYLVKALECLIFDKEDSAISYLALPHVKLKIRASYMLEYAVKVGNVNVVSYLLNSCAEEISFKDIVMVFSKVLNILMADHAERGNYLRVQEILALRFKSLAFAMEDLEEELFKCVDDEILVATVETDSVSLDSLESDDISALVIRTKQQSMRVVSNKSKVNPLVEFLVNLAMVEQYLLFDFCLKRLPKLAVSDAIGLIKICNTNAKFEAALLLIDRARGEIYTVINRLQLHCKDLNLPAPKVDEYQELLRKLFFKLPQYFEEDANAGVNSKAVQGIIENLNMESIEEDSLVALFSSEKLLKCVVQRGVEVVEPLLQRTLGAGHVKAGMLLLRRCKEDHVGILNCSTQISQLFLAAVKSDNEDIVSFCLDKIGHELLGINEPGEDSPLIQAARSQSYRVMAKLLDLIDKDEKQDYQGAFELEAPRQGGMFFQWGTKRLDQDIFAKLDEKVRADKSKVSAIN